MMEADAAAGGPARHPRRVWEGLRGWLALERRGDRVRLIIGRKSPDGKREFPHVVYRLPLPLAREVARALEDIAG